MFMLDKWKELGITERIIDAYNRGVIICGLSAGAICWFENIYTDSDILNGNSNEYKLYKGLGILKGTACPHYNHRKIDFDTAIIKNDIKSAYAIEDNSALVFIDGEFKESVSSTGNSYKIINENKKLSYETL